jgi:hypothetical protein
VSYPLKKISCIAPSMNEKLKALKIRTTEKLLEAAKSAKARKTLAEQLATEEQTVLRWANLADRMRIKGVREPYAELLCAAGVHTIKELRYRNPQKLAEAMAEANRKRKLVRFLPSQRVVERWIEEAKALDQKISY